jgi:hypothetical protein
MTDRINAAAYIADLESKLAAAKAEADLLRSALITWRNVYESGSKSFLDLAYEEGNDAMGVPEELRMRPGK